MILGFKGATEAFLKGNACPKPWEGFKAIALRKLDMVNAAAELKDLRSPPGNRLEKLSGDRAGQYSIRINDPWRVCFRWTEKGAEEVEIVDDH